MCSHRRSAARGVVVAEIGRGGEDEEEEWEIDVAVAAGRGAVGAVLVAFEPVEAVGCMDGIAVGKDIGMWE